MIAENERSQLEFNNYECWALKCLIIIIITVIKGTHLKNGQYIAYILTFTNKHLE